MKKEFQATFKVSKRVVFNVCYYTLSDNKEPHFTTSCNEFNYHRTDYIRGGQAQETLLPKDSLAYKFFQKWDYMHLKDLTDFQYELMTKQLEELKQEYRHIQNFRTNDDTSEKGTHIPFMDIVELSRS